jgi:hypothetical protein
MGTNGSGPMLPPRAERPMRNDRRKSGAAFATALWRWLMNRRERAKICGSKSLVLVESPPLAPPVSSTDNSG